jgi:hypothetical protein
VNTAEYQFYTKKEYLHELTRRFDAATPATRIVLMCMSFEPDEPEIAGLMQSLETAAHNGADITFTIDARCFLHPNGKPAPIYTQPGPLWYHRELPARMQPPFAAKRDMLNLLNHYPNVRAVITNTPSRRFSLPVAGRSHIKTAIVDDFVFIGGCNLDYPQNIDLMVGWRDSSVAGQLYGHMRSVAEAGHVRSALGDTDLTIDIDDTSRLLIDVGVRDQSLIFDSALALIDSAEEWLTITCQYFPNGITAEHLQAARARGVKTDIIYSDPRHQGLIGGSGQKVSLAIEKSRHPGEMFTHMIGMDRPMVHAKIIACDKGLMIGSHNYVRAGVRLGTAEIVLESSDVKLAEAAVTKLHQGIAAASRTVTSQ